MATTLDLNKASIAELEKIPGLTRSLATKIVQARKKQGRFVSFNDLNEIVSDASTRKAIEKATKVASATDDSSLIIKIQLDRAGKFPGQFAGYKVQASYPQQAAEAEQPTLQTMTLAADTNGNMSLIIDSPATVIGELKLVARSAAGEIRGQMALASLDGIDLIDFPVEPAALPAPQAADDPGFNRPSRIRGRVIDKLGRIQISSTQVVLWATNDDDAEDDQFEPVATATTDGQGYFSAKYPSKSFVQAYALVSVGRGQTVPVRLDEEGFFPEEVIVVIEAPRAMIDAKEEDCGCGGGSRGTATRNPDAADLVNGSDFSADLGQGRCVDFTRPDRTLQEFSFSYVVRTTEPSIKGMTLKEPEKISPQVWKEMLALSSLGDNYRYMRTANAVPEDAATEAMMLRSAKVNSAEVMRSEKMATTEKMASMTTAISDGISVDLVMQALQRPDKLRVETLGELAITSKLQDLLREIGKVHRLPPMRSRLDCGHPVDWDHEPTVYQACTIAHGHILHFKQEWIADGYSMGRLLYSLPLAPGQKKQIAVLDWERRESAVRQESLQEEESLSATLSRDRDIGEMVNSILTESSRGGSSADSGGFGGGLGVGAILGPVGGLLGIGGGYSSASSSAWQNSSRNVAANSLQSLRDRTSQAAAAMRAQRSTVVQSVSQHERVTAVTETVANYNHCHAMTVEYFEVLRHLLVRQRLTDVQECLFVPLQMSRFDRAKILRWKSTLKYVLPTRDLRVGLDALERIDNNYEGSDLPVGSYADQLLEYTEGEMTLRFQLARPKDKDDDFEPANWGWLGILLPSLSAQEQYRTYLKDQQFKDRIFHEQFGPQIARAFVNTLRFSWIDDNNNEHPLPIDTTLISNFVNDRPLTITLRMSNALSGVARKNIKYIKISDFALIGGVFVPLLQMLPTNSRVIVEGGFMSYRSRFASGYLFRNSQIRNDLAGSDAVRIYTPLTQAELRNPREEDKERARLLVDHVNEHIERYHHALWWRMSPDRRYMLLDGFEAPNSGGRSVASVVENQLIGIVGNSLIMPVARGFHLDPTFKQDEENPIDLLEHYQPNTPIEPVRIAIPTRGVYAEAVLGACNACEKKEEDRFWRWEESPIPDNPPLISPLNTDSRRADPPDMTAKDFPAPIIAMQNAPAAPDPTGLGAALSLLGTPNLFKDITGLEGNQRNAIEALKASLSTAQAFGEKAGNLALQARMTKDIDRAMRAIDTAREQGLLSDDQARSLTQGAIQSLIGAGPTTDPKAISTDELDRITKSAGENSAAVRVSRPSGENVEVDARPTQAEDSPRPVIILNTDTATANRRAFNPSTHDISGEIALGIQVRNAPAGYTVRWMRPEPAALDVVSPTAEQTIVRAKRPGLTNLDVAVFDGGTQIASTRLAIAVPQFVTVNLEDAAFTAVLTEIGIASRKNAVLLEARQLCRELLASANVRTVWLMAPFNETLPAHLGAAMVTTATLRGEPPAATPNLFGETTGTALGLGSGIFNETIDLYPGAYDATITGNNDLMIDTESQAIMMQIKSEASPSAALLDFAAKVFGRLIGETLAHEIVHSLLGTLVGPNFHNSPAVASDLMNSGSERSFRQRTGIEDTANSSPVDPANFVDHGLAAVGHLQATNQGHINTTFPVPPRFS